MRGARDARAESAPIDSLSLFGWGALVAFVAAFAPALGWLLGEYTDSIWRNGHGILLPLVIYWLARRALQRADLPAEGPSAWGLPFVVVGCAMSLIDATARTDYLGVLGIVFAAPGLSLLLLGARRTRAIAFPLSLIVFLFPIPVGVLDLFSLSTASGRLSDIWLGLFGLHVPRIENWLFLSSNYLMQITQNCSGLAPLYGGALVSIVVAYLNRSWWLGAALLLLCWPITVFVNSFRVAALVLLFERFMGPSVLDSPIHGLSGIATFWAVIVPILLVGVGFHRRSRSDG